MIDPGWKTSEFWKSLLALLGSAGGIVITLSTADWTSISEAAAKGGITLGFLAFAASILRAYIQSRTALKAAQNSTTTNTTVSA